MAATMAEGESIITGLPYLDRGYEDVVEKLESVGADVTRYHLDDKPEEMIQPLNYREIINSR